MKYNSDNSTYYFPVSYNPSNLTDGVYTKQYNTLGQAFWDNYGHMSGLFYDSSTYRPIIYYSDLPVYDSSGDSIYTPPVSFVDKYLIDYGDTPSYLRFSVSTTDQSEFVYNNPSGNGVNALGFYQTQEETTFRISIQKGSSTYVIPMNTYNINYPIFRTPTVNYNDRSFWNYVQTYSYTQGAAIGYACRLGDVSDRPVLDIPYWSLYNKCTELPSDNQLYIPDLVDYANTLFETNSFTYNDFCTTITGQWVLNNSVVFTQNLDYSSNLGKTPMPKNPSIHNPLDDTPEYNPWNMLDYAKVNFTSIKDIEAPDLDLVNAELDSDGVNLFAWIFNTVVSSPIGIMVILALTFIIIKAVIH